METRTYDYIMVQLASGEEQMWGGGENKVKALSSRIVACCCCLSCGTLQWYDH